MVVLQLQLRRLGFDLESIFGPLVNSQGIAFMYETDQTSVMQKFRAMWTEMGDYLSRQYAGTDSTISRVTRDGKEGFFGKLDHKTKVVRRFMINTLSENPMQNSIDIILGKHISTGYSSEQKVFIEKNLRLLADEFSATETIKLRVYTWNMGGVRVYEHIDMKQWLLPDLKAASEMPDILVIGL